MKQLIFSCLIIYGLIIAPPLWASNSHFRGSTQAEMQSWFGEDLAPHVVSGCQAATSGSTTLPAFACAGRVLGAAGDLIYTSQPSLAVGPLNNGDGTYWVALYHDISTAVGGWTRQTGSHYLWQKATTRPQDPTGGIVILQVTVTGGAAVTVTQVGSQSAKGPIDVSRLSGANLGAKLTTGLALLPPTGGVLDAQALIGPQTIASTVTITKSVTILLGAATITATGNPAFLVSGVSNVAIQHRSTVVVLSGINSSYLGVSGTVDNLRIEGAVITGTGVVGDAQYGINIPEGTTLSNFRVLQNNFSNLLRGVSFEYGSGSGGGGVNLLIEGNTFKTIVGTASGQGYGVFYTGRNSQSNGNLRIIGNHFEAVQRHAVYIASGSRAAVHGNTFRLHRTGVNTNNIVPALVIARSSHVTVTGNLFDTCADGAISIEPDELASPVDVRNITVTGNTFRGSLWSDIIIGAGAAFAGAFESISVTGNVIERDAAFDYPSLRLLWGKKVVFTGNTIFHTGSFAAEHWIVQVDGVGETAGTATYTNGLIFIGNILTATGTNIRAVRFMTAAATSGIEADFLHNRFILSGAGATSFAFQAAQTNPNILAVDTDNGGLDTALMTRTISLTGNPAIKANTPIKFHRSQPVSFNPPNLVAVGDVTSTTVGVTGALTTHTCIAGHNQIGSNKIMLSCHISAADVATVIFENREIANTDIANGTLTVDVWGH